jgi:hypothetical protein
VLAYVFWHRAALAVGGEAYEDACRRFHHGFATRRPGGLSGTACLRAEQLPWLGDGGPGLEDWYLVEDFAALGVLNEAAVGRGHVSAHDGAARLMGEGTGSIYRLLDGVPELSLIHAATPFSPMGWTAPGPASGGASSHSALRPSCVCWPPTYQRACGRPACRRAGTPTSIRARHSELHSCVPSRLASRWN